MSRLICVLSVSLLALSPAAAKDPVAAGREMAEAQCADCHAIDAKSKPKNADADAPGFVDVAKMPSTTALSIKVFLRTPHKNMPNILFTEKEVDAITAYILSLAGK